MSVISTRVHNISDVVIKRTLARVNDNLCYELMTIEATDNNGQMFEINFFNDKVKDKVIDLSIDDQRNRGYKS